MCGIALSRLSYLVVLLSLVARIHPCLPPVPIHACTHYHSCFHRIATRGRKFDRCHSISIPPRAAFPNPFAALFPQVPGYGLLIVTYDAPRCVRCVPVALCVSVCLFVRFLCTIFCARLSQSLHFSLFIAPVIFLTHFTGRNRSKLWERLQPVSVRICSTSCCSACSLLKLPFLSSRLHTEQTRWLLHVLGYLVALPITQNVTKSPLSQGVWLGCVFAAFTWAAQVSPSVFVIGD